MPSQQVIERLEELQVELEKISSAVIHIEEASKVAKTSAKVLEKVSELLNTIKELEEKHREDLVRAHLEIINQISEKLQILLADLGSVLKNLEHLVIETRELNVNISEYYTEIKKINFPERLGKIDNQISGINIGIGNLQTSIQDIQKKIDENQKSVILKLTEMDKKYEDNYTLVKKEIKTNRIITIVVGVVIMVFLLLIFLK